MVTEEEVILEVQQRGRGHSKMGQSGVLKQVGDNHGTPTLVLGKRILEEVGLKLNQTVRVRKLEGKNMMGWLIVIEPVAEN